MCPPCGVALGAPDVVQRRGAGYVLALDRSAIDIFRFETLATRGHEAMRDGDVVEARDAARPRPCTLWRGDALADVAYERVRAGRDRAARRRRACVATEARIDADLALGREAESDRRTRTARRWRIRCASTCAPS